MAAQLPQLISTGTQAIAIIPWISEIISCMPPCIIMGSIWVMPETRLIIICTPICKIWGRFVQIVITLAAGLIQAIPQLIAAIPQLVGAIIDTILSTNWLDG